jgi:nucleoside-diphosphate-sugar epimerase
MNLSNKKIIITGCLGIYGFEITKYLLNQNSKVIGLDIVSKNNKIKILKKKIQ